MDRFEIRNQMKLKRQNLTSSEVLTLSNKVFSNVLSLDFSKLKRVFIYKRFKNEVDTNQLISHFLAENKIVSYPVIIGEEMVAGAAKNNGELKSKFGTTEPTDYEILNEIDVCFVPLLACDKNKNRLGFGKGFYDKFLATHPCLKIGLCYDFQVVDNINPNAWDIPLDLIVTESQIF